MFNRTLAVSRQGLQKTGLAAASPSGGMSFRSSNFSSGDHAAITPSCAPFDHFGDCFRTSDVMTPWIRNSRAGMRSGYCVFSAFK